MQESQMDDWIVRVNFQIYCDIQTPNYQEEVEHSNMPTSLQASKIDLIRMEFSEAYRT
jgi:hypothetical protein